MVLKRSVLIPPGVVGVMPGPRQMRIGGVGTRLDPYIRIRICIPPSLSLTSAARRGRPTQRALFTVEV